MNNLKNMVDISNLVTVNSFARLLDCSTTYLYALNKKGEVPFVVIDGVAFIDKVKNKSLIKKESRKVARRINKVLSIIK